MPGPCGSLLIIYFFRSPYPFGYFLNSNPRRLLTSPSAIWLPPNLLRALARFGRHPATAVHYTPAWIGSEKAVTPAGSIRKS